MVIFHCYVSSPEGTQDVVLKVNWLILPSTFSSSEGPQIKALLDGRLSLIEFQPM